MSALPRFVKVIVIELVVEVYAAPKNKDTYGYLIGMLFLTSTVSSTMAIRRYQEHLLAISTLSITAVKIIGIVTIKFVM